MAAADEADEVTPEGVRPDGAPEGVRPVDLRDYVTFDDTAPSRVRVFATDVLTLDLWCLEPRQSTGALLYADADVAYTVVGGTAWFVTDEGEVGLDPLGSILVNAGVAHGIDNRAADPLVVVASASPPDDDARPDLPVDDTAAAVRLPRERGRLARLLADRLGPGDRPRNG